jgi:hypothetical protein
MSQIFQLHDHDRVHDDAGQTLAGALASLPSSPTLRWVDWLVAVIFIVVFAAELGVVFGVVKVGGLLHFKRSPGIETASLSPLEAAVKTQEPAPASEVSHVLPAEQPLIAASAEPPISWEPVTADWAKWNYDDVFKGAKSRRRRNTSRPKPTENVGDPRASARRDSGALAEEIYQPGRRAPGW